MTRQASEVQPEVIHSSVDVFEFYLKRLRLEEGVLLQLWSYEEVRRAVALYVRSVLPLAAATIYVAHEWTKRSVAGALARDFRLTPLLRLHGIGYDRNMNFVVSSSELEVVKQLARLVEYRLDGEIPGFGKEMAISLASVSYPRPLLYASSDGLLRWLVDENIQVLASNHDYMGNWLSGKGEDYAEYIQHWIKANWKDFNEIFYDSIIAKLLDNEKSSEFEPWDWQYIIEQEWTRQTPYLTPGLRIRLLVTVSSALSLGLAAVTTSVKKPT